MRHAKSSWAEPGSSDHDRALSKRGLRDAPRMGRYISDQGYAPDLIICSTAVRARETLRLALPAIQALNDPEVMFAGEVYGAVPRDILETIAQNGDTAGTILVVGHNPGLQLLALHLAGSGEPDDRDLLAQKFPTCGLAVIDFKAPSWSTIAQQRGELVEFTSPKRLAGHDAA